MSEKKKKVYPAGTGRPPKYKTAEELQEKIEDYFENGISYRKVVVGPPNSRRVIEVPVITITGLVLHCGFSDRSSFYKLEEQQEFLHTIKRARAFITREYEELLQNGLGAGAIFALKNFGWEDKSEVKNTGKSERVVYIEKGEKENLEKHIDKIVEE